MEPKIPVICPWGTEKSEMGVSGTLDTRNLDAQVVLTGYQVT